MQLLIDCNLVMQNGLDDGTQPLSQTMLRYVKFLALDSPAAELTENTFSSTHVHGSLVSKWLCIVFINNPTENFKVIITNKKPTCKTFPILSIFVIQSPFQF